MRTRSKALRDANESRNAEVSERNIELGDESARRLADALVRRRTELGWRSARSMGIEAGLDYRTITNLEACRRTQVSRNTLAVLELKLKWPAGYLNALLETPDSNKEETVELTVPAGTLPSDVLRARAIAQATFNAAIKGMSAE